MESGSGKESGKAASASLPVPIIHEPTLRFLRALGEFSLDRAADPVPLLLPYIKEGADPSVNGGAAYLMALSTYFPVDETDGNEAVPPFGSALIQRLAAWGAPASASHHAPLRLAMALGSADAVRAVYMAYSPIERSNLWSQVDEQGPYGTTMRDELNGLASANHGRDGTDDIKPLLEAAFRQHCLSSGHLAGTSLFLQTDYNAWQTRLSAAMASRPELPPDPVHTYEWLYAYLPDAVADRVYDPHILEFWFRAPTHTNTFATTCVVSDDGIGGAFNNPDNCESLLLNLKMDAWQDKDAIRKGCYGNAVAVFKDLDNQVVANTGALLVARMLVAYVGDEQSEVTEVQVNATFCAKSAQPMMQEELLAKVVKQHAASSMDSLLRALTEVQQVESEAVISSDSLPTNWRPATPEHHAQMLAAARALAKVVERYTDRSFAPPAKAKQRSKLCS